MLSSNNKRNLAKLGDGLDESRTVMVGEKQNKRKLGKNRGKLKPSWAFVETNILNLNQITSSVLKPHSYQQYSKFI